MTADVCDWNTPGADRYTGTVAAAIAAYGLPLATQRALIEAFQARRFTDSVVIDRDSIRGKTHDYEPDIRAMHFGSRGRVCGSVTRARWTPEHTETALVVCADAECIAWPAVCGNVFRLTRVMGTDRPLEPAVGAERAEGADPALTLPPTSAGSAFDVKPDEWTPSSHAYGPGPWVVAAEPPQWSPAHGGHTAPVPEPTTWAMLAAGLGGLAWRARR